MKTPQKYSRTPAEIRRDGNHLAHEKSLYLQQHAKNPIDWFPWGEAAFERARTEDKPIFLSIGYSSCHWCHVMEHEVFEQDDVADFMNDHFVCIKVDREERPDVDTVYMQATLMFTNGHGGWPMSVFLTPDLKPFFAGTYFPKPHFIGLTKRIADMWASEREGLQQDAESVANEVAANMPIAAGGDVLKLADLEAVVTTVKKYFDPRWGGVGNQKFPTPLRWQFLLHLFRKTGNEDVAGMVRLTLDKMGDGGIHDHIGGGFHRYTVEQTWLVPHFEKMLYDNAQLAALYLEAAAVFDNPRYDDIARDTLDFMIRDMSDGENPGGFFGSYDADSGGEEGSFYVWTPEDITAAVGETDGPALAMLLGVSEKPNFEGMSIITRRVPVADVAAKFQRPEAEIATLFDTHREKLRTVRAKRVWPDLDKKIVTSWNGLAITAFALGYLRTGDERYKQAAERAVEFLWSTHRTAEGALWRTSTDGVAANAGILDDYAFLANGLLDLFQATGNADYLSRAAELVAYADVHFDAGEQGYFLTPDTTDAPLGRQIEIADSVEPSGLSALLDAKLKLAAIDGSESARGRVAELIGAYSDSMKRAGLELGLWYDIALKLHGPFYEVVISGDRASDEGKALAATIRRLIPRFAVIVWVPAEGPREAHEKRLATAVGKTAQDGRATAYVCRFGACQAPTHDPQELARQLREGWTR